MCVLVSGFHRCRPWGPWCIGWPGGSGGSGGARHVHGHVPQPWVRRTHVPAEGRGAQVHAPDWYDVHLARLPRNFFQPGFCYVVDDSVSTYAVVTRGNKLWWVDPHVDPDTRVVPEPFQYAVHMGRGKGWMILRVACR